MSDAITATEARLRIDLRRKRADEALHLIMKALTNYIPDRCRSDAYRALIDAFHKAGAELVTDYLREEIGLPPRGLDGWTAEELLILERKRLEIMARPIILPSPFGDRS